MNQPQTIMELITTHSSSSAWEVLTDSTQAAYTFMNKVLIKEFPEAKVFYSYNPLAREQADYIFSHLGVVGLTNQRRNQLRRHLHVLWQWGVVNIRLAPECNPSIFMPQLKHEPREGNPFTKEEVSSVMELVDKKMFKNQSLLNETETMVCWYIKFLFETGMRPGEAMSLLTTDVVIESGDKLIQIVGAKGRESGKVSRYISVTPGVKDCIDWAMKFRYSRKTISSDTLFVTTLKGGKLLSRNVTIIFARIMKLAGLENKQVYDLRRGAATAIIHDPRYGITVAQKQLGHKNIQTTMRYENLNKKAAAKLFKGYEE